MLRGLGRSRLLGTGRWAAALTAALVLVQLDPASRAATALVGSLASGLGGAPAREAEPPSRSPGGESSESEESVVGRGKESRPVPGLAGGDEARPAAGRAAARAPGAAPLPAGRPDGSPAGGRAIRLRLRSHRC